MFLIAFEALRRGNGGDSGQSPNEQLTINNAQLTAAAGGDFSTQNPSDSLVEMTQCSRGCGERNVTEGTMGKAQMNN